jgi:fibronectin-binding autotransporter adhesin
MKQNRRIFLFAPAVFLTSALNLSAATYSFKGAGTTSNPTTANWTLATAWEGGVAPTSSLDNVLSFANSGTTSYTASNTFSNDFNLNRIILASNSTGSTTINSGTLNFLNDSVAAGPRITQDGNSLVTINSFIKLANTVTLDGSGTGTLNLNGIISGAGGLTKTGPGITSLGGASANTYTGLTTISAGTLDLNKTAAGTTALAGNVTVGTGTLRLLQQNQIADSASVTVTSGGVFNLNGRGETISSLAISSTSASSLATLDLGGQVGSTALIVGAPITFGDFTQVSGTGTIRRTGGGLTLNFDGGQLNGASILAGVQDAGTVINVSKGMGNGTLTLGTTSGSSIGTVNLNQIGTMNLGATIIASSNSSGSTSNGLAINVANTATGMSGGIITTALAANAANPVGPERIYNSATNSLVFQAGGTGFDLSGGVLDVRSMGTVNTMGSIVTNGNALTISGGSLLGNRLTSTTGAITLSSGTLVLRDIRSATATNFAISTLDGTDGRTIKMLSGNSGVFSVANLQASTNYVTIGAQASGGTWDRGTINAGQNYTITANTSGGSAFGSTFASYTIGDNSGLLGLALGANGVPTQLTLGNNSGFFVASTTSGARTYNVGTSLSNDVVVSGTGSFTFGLNNTSNSSTQIINLNRDKGNANVTLLSNGLNANNAINLTTDQTGSGNLYVATRNLALNSGATFGGTGGIYTDLLPGDGMQNNILGGGHVSVNGSNSVAITFTINGTLNGTNVISLNQDTPTLAGSFVVGSTATIGGNQTWWGAQSISSAYGSFFANNLTNGASWTGTVALGNAGSSGTLEASTSVASPSTSSNYKFTSLTLMPVGSAPTGAYRLVNNVQNDGGSGKEAFYASSFSVGGGIGDGSNGRYIFNLNGQDLYVDRFQNVTGLQNKGLVWQNDAVNSVSQIRAVGTQGDTLTSASFAVLNGATIEIVGGDYNALVYGRNTGAIVADSAAVPNAPTVVTDTSVKTTLTWDGTSSAVGGFTSFLGSGLDRGTNTNSNALGTNGTFRVVGGSFASSGYILNPLGTVGTIDTTGTGDTTLNNVLIRGNTASDVGGAGNASTFPALVVAGTTNIIGNLVLADATGAANQATLRVGGVTASTSPTASGTALLNVAGNLTVGATNNLAIQSNATVKVGGNVSIQGVGVNLANNVTGLGVGINSASHFTLNGNSGVATPQTVSIVPTVGNFHVGDGSAGTLAGTAAQARLLANLSAASADINGAASSLDLNNQTLTVNAGLGTLLVGGNLKGSGTVNGSVQFLASSVHAPGNSPGVQTITGSADYDSGSTFAWELDTNYAQLTLQSGTPVFDQVSIAGGLNIDSGANITLTFNGVGSTVDFNNVFWGTSQQWLVAESTNLTGSWTLSGVSVDSLGNLYSDYGTFTLTSVNDDVYLNWTVVPEPSTALLAGLGIAGLLIRRRRN